jgi:hypothetical protein
MSSQVSNPQAKGGSPFAAPASFLLHLGNIVYKDEDPMADPRAQEQADMYNTQFYAQYRTYVRKIFAIPGNHDSDVNQFADGSPIIHFFRNFCALSTGASNDNRTDQRKTVNQPYLYWLFDTPLGYIICLYTNCVNGGQLDDPQVEENPQYQWLVETLKYIKSVNDGKAVFLALHYPPYSGSPNFAQRGDPNLGPTPRTPPDRILQPLGEILQQAFRESGQYPDVVLSAHANLYQRITYTYSDGRQIPYIIAGSGGHVPVEKLSRTCSGESLTLANPPFDVVRPLGLTIPSRDSIKVVSYNDRDNGFLRLTVDMQNQAVVGEFFAAYSESNPNSLFQAVSDSFTLNLRKHTIN